MTFHVTCEVDIKNKRAKLHRDAEEMLTYSREGGRIGRAEFAAALRQQNLFCPKPLSEKTKSILTDIMKKSSDKASSTLVNWPLNFTGKS